MAMVALRTIKRKARPEGNPDGLGEQ